MTIGRTLDSQGRPVDGTGITLSVDSATLTALRAAVPPLMPRVLQRFLVRLLSPMARRLGYRAIDAHYGSVEFWQTRVEQNVWSLP